MIKKTKNTVPWGKGIIYISNGKTMVILLTAQLKGKISLHEMSYFPKAYIRSKGTIKVELDLSNNAKKD